MVPELLDDDMADDELLDATLGGAADKRDTKLLDAKMADGELLDTELGGIGAETADQPDTELLDAEPLASELTSATIFWRFNAKLPSASPEAKLLRFLLLIWLNFVGGSLR